MDLSGAEKFLIRKRGVDRKVTKYWGAVAAHQPDVLPSPGLTNRERLENNAKRIFGLAGSVEDVCIEAKHVVRLGDLTLTLEASSVPFDPSRGEDPAALEISTKWSYQREDSQTEGVVTEEKISTSDINDGYEVTRTLLLIEESITEAERAKFD